MKKDAFKKMFCFIAAFAYLVCSLSLILNYAAELGKGEEVGEVLVKTIIVSAMAAPFAVNCVMYLFKR